MQQPPKEVDAADLEAHFDQFLDAAERGEAFAIIRNGRRIGFLKPHEVFDQAVQDADR